MRTFWQILHREPAGPTLQFYSFVNILPGIFFTSIWRFWLLNISGLANVPGFTERAFVNISEEFKSNSSQISFLENLGNRNITSYLKPLEPCTFVLGQPYILPMLQVTW